MKNRKVSNLGLIAYIFTFLLCVAIFFGCDNIANIKLIAQIETFKDDIIKLLLILCSCMYAVGLVIWLIGLLLRSALVLAIGSSFGFFGGYTCIIIPEYILESNDVILQIFVCACVVLLFISGGAMAKFIRKKARANRKIDDADEKYHQQLKEVEARNQIKREQLMALKEEMQQVNQEEQQTDQQPVIEIDESQYEPEFVEKPEVDVTMPNFPWARVIMFILVFAGSCYYILAQNGNIEVMGIYAGITLLYTIFFCVARGGKFIKILPFMIVALAGIALVSYKFVINTSLFKNKFKK